MEWKKLDIRKVSVLKKEIDVAIGKLKESIKAGDEGQTQALLRSFRRHIDLIEDFRTHNDNDERSILFDNERLRLRQAVHEYKVMHQDDEVSDNAPIRKIIATTAKSVALKRMVAEQEKLKSQQMKQSLSLNRPLSGSLSPAKNGEGSPVVGLASAPKNIYNWETGDKEIKKRNKFSIEGATFSPSDEVGVYIRDDVSLDDTKNEKYHDMYFVLNAEELSILASRLQHRKVGDRGIFKNAHSARSLQHTTPFVDRNRIEKELYRPDKPEKWVGQASLRPNMK